MQRLNIPLRRYQHTTRLSRRVVSLFAILAGIGCVCVLWAGALWYGRDTTSAAAPEGSVAVMHLSLNRWSWADAKRALHDIPLVSNRPLTIDDIEPFTLGECSLFVDADGNRSVAIRSSKNVLPTKTLDSLGILAEDMGKGVYLLSDRPLARMDWKPSHVWFGSIHSPFAAHIGSVYFLNEDKLSGSLFASKNELSIRLPKQHLAKLPWKTVPDGIIAEMSTPASPNTDISVVAQAMDTILSSYQTPSASLLSERFLQKPGSFVLTKKEDAVHFLVVSSDADFDKDQQQKVIQTAASLENPRIQAFPLPDNSNAKEMVVDPSYSTVEETTVAGTLVSRVSTKQGGYFYLADANGSFAITDDQSLLEFWLKGGDTKTTRPACDANTVYANIDALLAYSSLSLNARTADLLTFIGGTYGSIGVQERAFTTVIHVCY